jgi:hypothetical protein
MVQVRTLYHEVWQTVIHFVLKRFAMKGSLVLLLLWFCPLVALMWFLTSLDARIESGWEYVSRPRQIEFTVFKIGIAALMIAPAVGLAFSRRNSLILLASAAPALLLTKEAVAAWMIVLVEWARGLGAPERVSPSQQLLVCLSLTLFGLALAYGPLLVDFAVRRRARTEIEG